MKKIATLLIFTSLIWACNNSKHNGKHEVFDSADHHETAEDLVLNDGDKWKADSSTAKNVENLFAVIDAFNSQTDKSLLAYKKTADDLQGALDKMIRECKMEGPNHEALHKWLMPLIGMVKSLKQASDDDDAAEQLQAISEQINLYPQFFERG